MGGDCGRASVTIREQMKINPFCNNRRMNSFPHNAVASKRMSKYHQTRRVNRPEILSLFVIYP
jgi:hypothetical protein